MKRNKIYSLVTALTLGVGVLVNNTYVLATNNSFQQENTEVSNENDSNEVKDEENIIEEKVVDSENDNKVIGEEEGDISVATQVLDGPSIDTPSAQSTSIYSETHSIMGQAQVSKEAFKKYFKEIAEKNGYVYKLNCTIDEFVDLAYEEAAIEGVRADIVIAQAIWETGYFQYGGIVDANDNNYAGLGATGAAGVKEKFQTPRLGIRAQVQHLKAYASTNSLVLNLVDPRFKYVTRGSAPSVEELSGKWAVPGYSTSTYSSLANAAKNNDTYGQRIYNLVKFAMAYNSVGDNSNNNGNNSNDTNQTPENNAPEVTTKIGTVKVSTSLNVRKGPGTSYSIVDRLYNGKQVTVVGEANGFYKIQYDGKEGYVSKDYITVSTSPSNNNSGSNSGATTAQKIGITTNSTTNLNVRKGAGTNYGIIGTLKPKSQVIILGQSGSWLKIAYYVNGTKVEGYVSSSYIKIS